jgi:hypothetical protein
MPRTPRTTSRQKIFQPRLDTEAPIGNQIPPSRHSAKPADHGERRGQRACLRQCLSRLISLDKPELGTIWGAGEPFSRARWVLSALPASAMDWAVPPHPPQAVPAVTHPGDRTCQISRPSSTHRAFCRRAKITVKSARCACVLQMAQAPLLTDDLARQEIRHLLGGRQSEVTNTCARDRINQAADSSPQEVGLPGLDRVRCVPDRPVNQPRISHRPGHFTQALRSYDLFIVCAAFGVYRPNTAQHEGATVPICSGGRSGWPRQRLRTRRDSPSG